MCWVRRKNAGDQMSQLFLLHSQGTLRRDHVFLRLRMWQIYIVHHQKEATQSALYINYQLSSLALYKTLQPERKFSSFNACLVDG